jgi:hypothetical protein
MKRYIIERTVGKLTREQIDAASKKSNEVLQGMPELTWIRSYYSEEEGKIYCEYYAPNPEAIYAHAELAGFPVDRVSEVTIEFNPEMFR